MFGKHSKWIMWPAVVAFLLAGAAIGLFTIYVSFHTVGKYAATGEPVTNSGWLALVASVLSSSGLTLAGLLTAFIQWKWPGAQTPTAPQILELSQSFAAMVQTPGNVAAERRFLFSIVDVAPLLKGVSASHEAGVIVIKYAGYADPQPVAPKP